MQTNLNRLNLKPGDILLTSGVGGTSTNWRDNLLSNLIIKHQKMILQGFIPQHSHTELITDTTGGTFAARWRTRHRPLGLLDYIGCKITIGRSPYINEDLYYEIWAKSDLNKLDGKIYPVHRLLLQGVGVYIFPWVTDLGAGSFAICSEVVAKFLNTGHKVLKALGMDVFKSYEGQWRGVVPGQLERDVKYGDDFEVVFSGILTQGIYEKLIGFDS